MQQIYSTDGPGLLPARIGNGPIMMSSREIAELCEKRHDHVLRDIRAYVGAVIQMERGQTVRAMDWNGDEGVQLFGETPIGGVTCKMEVNDQNGQSYPIYFLDKSASLTVVSGYNVLLRKRIIDRWIELETGATKPVSTSAKVNELASLFGGLKRIARLAGLKGNSSILSAAQAARKITGTDPLVLIDATHIVAEIQEQYLGPRQIGEREVPPVTAQRVNKALEAAGLQIEHRKRGKHAYWELTAEGRKAGGEYLDTGKKHGDGTPVKQIKWPASVIDRIREYLKAAAA